MNQALYIEAMCGVPSLESISKKRQKIDLVDEEIRLLKAQIVAFKACPIQNASSKARNNLDPLVYDQPACKGVVENYEDVEETDCRFAQLCPTAGKTNQSNNKRVSIARNVGGLLGLGSQILEAQARLPPVLKAVDKSLWTNRAKGAATITHSKKNPTGGSKATLFSDCIRLHPSGRLRRAPASWSGCIKHQQAGPVKEVRKCRQPSLPAKSQHREFQQPPIRELSLTLTDCMVVCKKENESNSFGQSAVFSPHQSPVSNHSLHCRLPSYQPGKKHHMTSSKANCKGDIKISTEAEDHWRSNGIIGWGVDDSDGVSSGTRCVCCSSISNSGWKHGNVLLPSMQTGLHPILRECSIMMTAMLP